MTLPDAKISMLGNGIRVVSEELPHLRSVSMGVLVAAGSASEDGDIMGISHFIEHMSFKGTKKRSALEIAQALDNVGGKLNAYTGKEFTVFYAVVQDKHLDISADVLSDILINSIFDPKELELEKKVVLEEIRMYEDTPDEQIHDLFTSTAFNDNPMGNITLGEEKTVKAIDRTKIVAYRERMYFPGNIIISVAGNACTKAFVDLITEKFASMRGKGVQKALPDAKLGQRIKLKKKKTQQAHIAIGTSGPSQKDDDRFAFAVMDNALGGSMSSRLFQEIREKRGLAYSVFSFNQSYKNTGLYEIYAGTNNENASSVIELLVAEVSKIKKAGITKEELERSKEFIKGSMVLGMESSNSRMNYIAKSLYYYDRIVPIEEVFDDIDSVTLEDVMGILDKYVTGNTATLAVIGDLEKLPLDRLSF